MGLPSVLETLLLKVLPHSESSPNKGERQCAVHTGYQELK